MPHVFMSSEDVRAILRLVGEVHDLVVDPPALFSRMVDGLLRIVGADVGCMSPIHDFRPGGEGLLEGNLVRSFDDRAAHGVVVSALRSTVLNEPAVAEMTRGFVPGRVMTRLRRELLTDTGWARTPYGAELRRVAGVRDVLYSAAPSARPTDVLGLILYRTGAGASRFGEVERDLVDLFREQMVPIYRGMAARPPAARRAARLRPDYRAALCALLAGLSEKEAAGRLALSVHTLHDRVRALYALFGVTSRAELLALFIPPNAIAL
jgi:hypothetical protein